MAWDAENLRKIGETYGEEVLADYFDEKELEVLNNKFKEVKEKDESTMGESAERYKTNSIMNIVLYFEAKQHQEVIEMLDKISYKMDNYDKSDVVRELINFYKEKNNLA